MRPVYLQSAGGVLITLVGETPYIVVLHRRDPDEWARQKIKIDVEFKLIVEVVAAIESLGQNPSDVFNRIIQRAAQSVDVDS